jgi:hypothetical protein
MGLAMRASVILMIIVYVRPPKYAAISPIICPIITDMLIAPMATVNEVREA